jgi:preprotein translocase subunit SecB
MSKEASFQLSNYLFKNVKLEFDKEIPKEISVNFVPSGVFISSDHSYELSLIFSASREGKEDFVQIECVATYSFINVNSQEEIPTYFYANALAIIFPYIRAFVSNITLQSNIPPLILPTYNLIELEQPLRENTLTQ